MTADLITGKDVAGLNNHQLRAVLNALVTAEACQHRIPLLDLHLTTRETDPDAGIDARITWSAIPHETFKTGLNVIQYKSGKVTKPIIEKEFRKPGVQRALKSGGAYLLLVGHDYVAATADVHSKTLRDLCKAKKIPIDNVRIVFGGALARWISRYPAVCARPELGLEIRDFVTVEKWRSGNKQMANPFKADALRRETMQHIQEFLDSDNDSVLRLEGRGGVGKTRLALEAVSDPKYASRALYASNAENAEVQPFLSFVYSHLENIAIAVVDECEFATQRILAQYAENSAGRIKLICVGVAEVLYSVPPPMLTKVYQLKPLGDSEMEAALSESFPSVPKQFIGVGVRLSGGYVKLAMFVVGVLETDGQQVPLELARVLDIREFLRKFVDAETLKGLQILSLLARLGWEEQLREEADAIADFVHLPIAQLESAVKRLRDQGVVVARGRYLYVSPDLLAVKAAADLWDEKGSRLIDLLLRLKPDPRRQLLKRLAMMGEHTEVRKAVERILSMDGLYPSLKELDEPFLAEVFRILSHAVPASAVDLLDGLILPASREDIQGFENGRREVMWSIESLLRWPNTSLRAARITMRLALSETENLGNNATAIFQTFFHVFLSGSPVPLMDRFVLIDELLSAGDLAARQLAVKALAGTLQPHESRFGGEVDELSNKPYPPEWRPEKNQDIWNPRRRALLYLQKIGQDDDEAAASARKKRIDSVHALLQYGQADDAIQILESTSPTNDEERRVVMESCDWVSRMEGLPDALKERICRIRDSTFGTEYFDRLRRWIGRRLHSDFDMDTNLGYAVADKRAQELAEEGFREGIGQTELAWLISPEAENVWLFGHRLGELDRSGKFFHDIFRATPNEINCMFLAAYIRGRGITCGETTREGMLDEIAPQKPDAAFGATWRNDATVAGAERIIHLVSSGRVAASTLRVLLYGVWVDKLPNDYAIKVVGLMLDRDGAANAESVLGIIDHAFRTSRIAVAEFGDLVWRALETKATPRSPNFDWHWAQVAERVAALDPARFARIFLTFFESDETWLGTDSAQGVLQIATRANPAAVWGVIGPALAGDDLTGVRLRLKLDHWFGELVPSDILLDWVHKHGRRGVLIAAGLLNAKAGLSGTARLLIKEVSKPEDVLGRLAAGIGTGVFAGSISNHMEGELSTLEKWAADEEPKIRDWARAALAHGRRSVDRQRLLEQEEEF